MKSNVAYLKENQNPFSYFELITGEVVLARPLGEIDEEGLERLLVPKHFDYDDMSIPNPPSPIYLANGREILRPNNYQTGQILSNVRSTLDIFEEQILHFPKIGEMVTSQYHILYSDLITYTQIAHEKDIIASISRTCSFKDGTERHQHEFECDPLEYKDKYFYFIENSEIIKKEESPLSNLKRVN